MNSKSSSVFCRILIVACLMSVSGLLRAESISASPNPSNSGSYTVSWSGVNGAQSYPLHESINGGETENTYWVSSTSKSFTGKAAGTYKYTIDSCLTLGPPAYPNWQIQCGYDFGSVTVTVRPPVPTGLDGPSIDYNGDFTISWNTAPGFTSKLRERLNSGTWSTVHSGSAESDFRPNRSPGTWWYRVRACMGSNCSNWSAAITVPVEAPPATPTGLDGPTRDYNGAFAMTWNSASRATSYKLHEIRPNNTTHAYTILSGTSQAVTGKDTAPGTYSYAVRGCNPEAVCGNWSGYVDVIVEPPPGTPVLQGPEVPVPHDEIYAISWNDTGPDIYQVEELPAGGTWQPVTGPDLLSRTLSRDPGTYSYHVKACHPENVCSDWSQSIGVTVYFAFNTDYVYDAQGRLIQVKHPNGVVTDYGYDSADNRKSKESSLEN